jgi:hypothetical protein
MAKHFKPYDFNLTPNGSQVVYAVGKYLKVLNATGTISVRVDGGSAVPLQEGQGLELEDGETWSEITVTDTSGLANSGRLFIGAGRFTDQRFNGDVNATLLNDPDSVRALQGPSYRSWAEKTFAGAGTEAHGLYNPVGSGILILLRSVELLDSAVANIQQRLISKYTAVGAAPAYAPGAKPVGAGSIASVGGVYIAGASPAGTAFYADGANTFSVTGLRDYRCLVLDPGQAFNVFHNASAAAKVATIFAWDEVPI